ncbi:cadherin-17 [Rhinophrynus dorsalis]
MHGEEQRKIDRLRCRVCLETIVQGQLPTHGPLKDMEFRVEEEGTSISLHQFVSAHPTSVQFELLGEKDNHIEIQPNDGLLKITGPLDRERKSEYRLKVQTRNSGGNIEEGPYSIIIIVEDINDHQPMFNQSEYAGEVRERSRPGIPFVRVYATDADDPSTPNAQISYSIMQQLPDTEKVPLFQINNKTGAISATINGSKLLSVEKQSSYQLIVMASDSGERPFTKSVKVAITVKENIWLAPKPVNIVENSTDPHPMKITQVRWNDDNVIYELHQRERYPRFPFSIDRLGDIYVTQPLDREEREQYIFYAMAKNQNGDAVAKPVEIEVNVLDINDNPPVCPSAVTLFEIQENEGIGSTIGLFQATDMDKKGTENSLLSYLLLEQSPTIPSNNMFLVTDFTGEIQLQKSGLNFKEVDLYVLKVEVSDSGKPNSLKTNCSVHISVIDINDQIPIFEKSDYGNVTVPENAELKTVLMEIQANDGDQPLTGSSAIIYEITEGDSGKLFSIDTDPQTNRGFVKIAQHLDFESAREHNLLINAKNPEPLFTGISYNESSVTRLKIIVTNVDEKPYFVETIYQKQVRENVPIGTKIATIAAVDPEGDTVRFTLRNDRRNWLRIDGATGEIFSNAELDREKESHYQVEVVASETNNPQMNTTVPFQLFLEDVNDNPPRLAKDYYRTYFCHPLTEQKSIVIVAWDDDLYRFGPRLTFSLEADENVTKDWEITPINGTSALLSMKHTRFEIKIYNVPILINDRGTPPIEAKVFIPVSICSCTSKNQCATQPVEESRKPSIGMAIGILLGTLAFIGLIIAAVFISINRKKKKEKKAQGSDARTPTETLNLAS